MVTNVRLQSCLLVKLALSLTLSLTYISSLKKGKDTIVFQIHITCIHVRP